MSNELHTHLNVIDGIRNKTIAPDDFDWEDIRALQTLFSLLPQAVAEEFRKKYGSTLIATVAVVVEAVDRETPDLSSEDFMTKVLEYKNFIKEEFTKNLEIQVEGREVGRLTVAEVRQFAKENAEKTEGELYKKFGGRRFGD